jgi:hypothetical protein
MFLLLSERALKQTGGHSVPMSSKTPPVRILELGLLLCGGPLLENADFLA